MHNKLHLRASVVVAIEFGGTIPFPRFNKRLAFYLTAIERQTPGSPPKLHKHRPGGLK